MKEDRAADSTPESFFCPLGTELILQIEGNDAQLRSSLVGMERDKYLIIRIPKAPGLEPLELIDKPIKAIFLYDGTIFAFISTILVSIVSPSPLFFISCPETMQRHELRKNLRMDCSIPVVIRNKDKTEQKSIMTDLSASGCRVTISNNSQEGAEFKVDDMVEVTCDMLGIDQDGPVRGSIKNLAQDRKRMHLGIQFETDNAPALERIQIYVNRILDFVS
jgi:c-di-GMP-binding flagellar brake protein YcgR